MMTDNPEQPSKTGEGEEWSYATRVDQGLPPSFENVEGGRDRSGDDGAEDDDKSADARKREPTRDGNETQREPKKQESQKANGDRSTSEEPDQDDHEEPPPAPSPWVFVVVGLVLAGLLAWGGYAHWRRDHDASATQKAEVEAVPTVRTTIAQRDDKPLDLTLPGQTEALETANLYARATGYIAERRVDIGSRVKKGDLLVHIAAPDLDQELAQAEAQVGQVKAAEAQAHAQVSQADANVNLAKVTLARTATLTDKGYETQQNRDNQTANLLAQQATQATAQAGVKVAEANTKAQLATVDRLKALAGFEDVVAPFDGVVTQRNVEVGDLISSNASSSSMPLFSMARDNVIRVTVQVPQTAVIGVRDGLPAKIEVSQMPGMIFRGTVTRSSVALLSSARTLDTEVDIPNDEGLLRPGLFAYITIDIPQPHPSISIPAEALIFDQRGLQVATVEDGKTAIHSVKIYRDLGTSIQLSEGLNGGEQVILSPPALLRGGTKVNAKPADQQGDNKSAGAG